IALEGSERVLLASLGRPQPVQFDGTGEARLLQLIEEMPLRSGGGNAASLRGLFEKRGRDSVLVLVSDFQDREPLVQLLRDARRRGVRAIAISIAAEEELNPSLDGFSRLQAIGGGETKLRVDERVLQAYREEVQHYRQSVAKAVHAAGAAFIELDSADPIEPLIVDLMRAGVLG